METATPMGRDSADGPCPPLAIRPRCAGPDPGRAGFWPPVAGRLTRNMDIGPGPMKIPG
jgi:hypothetical protein